MIVFPSTLPPLNRKIVETMQLLRRLCCLSALLLTAAFSFQPLWPVSEVSSAVPSLDALSTLSSPVLVADLVFRGKKVTAAAVGSELPLSPDQGRPQAIHLTRHGLEVARVEAAPVPAEVIELLPVGYRTDEQLIGQSVSATNDLFVLVVESDAPVALQRRARPHPALVGPSQERLYEQKEIEWLHGNGGGR